MTVGTNIYMLICILMIIFNTVFPEKFVRLRVINIFKYNDFFHKLNKMYAT